MNIKDFKIGQVVTRNEGMKYEHSGSIDGSYLGEMMKLVSYSEEAKMFSVKFLEGIFKGDEHVFSFGRDAWDEGWCEYPIKMLGRKSYLKRIFGKTLSNKS